MGYAYEYYFDSDEKGAQTIVWRKNLDLGGYEFAIDPAYPNQAPGSSDQDAVWLRSVCRDSDFLPEEKFNQEEVPAWAL